MKVSLRWLHDLAPGLEASADEVAERAAMRGFPVEEVQPLARGLEGIVVAHVLEVRSHPNADRLRLCRVDGGTGELQVVCGADNVQAGGWYPFAPVGATLPGGMQVGEAKLRGERSQGMLCSERELGLGPGREGLMVLAGPHAPGEPLVEALGLRDVRMDVEVTSNRPDLLSHEGIARELGPEGQAGLTLPPIPGDDVPGSWALDALALRSDPSSVTADGLTVRIEAPELCLRYLGLVVRGVRVGPSPPWLQARMHAIGARPINNVVDATNYVLHELGQPLHAFDLSRIRDRTIVVRTARPGEELRTLDGEDRKLDAPMLAICDVSAPVAIAGVMGGAESEVTEATTDLLLECALFAPASIRSTRKALGLSTEASYRFERGVDPEGMVRALERAARLVVATAGGVVSGPIADCCPRPFSRARVSLRPDRVGHLLGVPFTPDMIRELLEPLGFAVANGSGLIDVEVPGFRSYDVTREVDLIEEIARVHGYDRFPEEPRPFRPGTVPDHPLFGLEDRIRDELTSWGFFEAQTPAFAPVGQGEVELLNPISTEERFLRNRLLPGLLRRLEHNAARGNRDVRLFELGTAFGRSEAGALPLESVHLALVMHGLRTAPHWSGGADRLDVWDLKGVLARITGVLLADGWTLSSDRPAAEAAVPLEPWASLYVTDREGRVVGAGGRLDARDLDLPPWAQDVWVAELVLPANPVPTPPSTYVALPVHPGVERDLALLLPGGVRVEDALGTARAHGGGHLTGIGVFDVYRDESMPAGHRSVAVRLRFRAPDRTLTDPEVGEAVQRIVKALQEELSVGIRGQADGRDRP